MAIPESFVLTAGTLHQAKFALAGLVVDERKMNDNLAVSRSLIVAEAVMMGRAPQIGRQEAHDVVYDACRQANDRGSALPMRCPQIHGYRAASTVPQSKRSPHRRMTSGLRPPWSIGCRNPQRAENQDA